MKLELSDEQRHVLEEAIEDQAHDLRGRIKKRQERHQDWSVDVLIRHRDILDRLLVELRYPL